MKNSLYEYTLKECLDVQMPNDYGYTWYDIAMFDTCKEMLQILKDNANLYGDLFYFRLKELNYFMLSNIVKDKHNNTIEHRYNFLNKLCSAQISEMGAKYVENTEKLKPLLTAFSTYYDCLCEYKMLNDLEIKTLEIITNEELFNYPHTRMLFDKVSKISTKVGPDINDVKALNDAYVNAYYETKEAPLQEETKKLANQYLNATKSYMDILNLTIQRSGRK